MDIIFGVTAIILSTFVLGMGYERRRHVLHCDCFEPAIHLDQFGPPVPAMQEDIDSNIELVFDQEAQPDFDEFTHVKPAGERAMLYLVGSRDSMVELASTRPFWDEDLTDFDSAEGVPYFGD